MIATGVVPQYTQIKPLSRRMIVPQSARLFSQRLNQCLDETGAPISVRERALVLSKIIDIPKQVAWGLLEGNQLPGPSVLQKIANEFEVDAGWLSGEKGEDHG